MRVLIAGIYVVLVVGSLTMLYPFGVMVSGSLKSPVDVHEYDLIPRYFHDDVMLYRKYVEERHNESIAGLNGLYRTHYARFEDVYPSAAYSAALVKDWRDFLDSDGWDREFPGTGGRLPLSFFLMASYTGTSLKYPQIYQAWQQRLMDRFRGDVNAMNRAWGTNYDSFLKVWAIGELWDNRRYIPPKDSPLYDDFTAYKAQLRREQPRFLLPISGDGAFLESYVYPKYGREIQAYNQQHGTHYASTAELRLSETVPENPKVAADWEEFVRTEVHLQNIRVTPAGEAAFKAYLRDFYTAAGKEDPARTPLDIFVSRYGADAAAGHATLDEALADCHLGQPVPLDKQVAVDFAAFISTACPLETIRLVTADVLFARFLEKRYGSIDALNQAVRNTMRYPLGTREDLVGKLSPVGRIAIEVMASRRFSGVPELFRAVDDDLKSRDPAASRPTLLDRFDQPSLDHLKAALGPEDRALLTQIAEMDAVTARPYATFRDAPIQERARDWEDLNTFKRAIKRECIVTNYRHVLRFILFHGRALFNTAVLVVVSVLCALTINPLAAYALSRYELPSTYKVLLFFMATMAFPAEVTMIPNFLLLKNFPAGYLILIPFFLVLFLLARRTIRGSGFGVRVWGVVETALVLVVLAVLTWGVVFHHKDVLAATGLDNNPGLGIWLWVLTAGVAAMLVLSRVKGARPEAGERGRSVIRDLEPVAGAVGVGVLAVLAAPLITRMLGYGSPTTSLLNTFWALVLPGMANGFSIFLLKGFFDSLPPTLYECAQMEGAGEMWMFFRVTLPLSKPIMAVIALQTFNLAYMTFMYAFIVCQDEKMWTLMVYLYELQIDSPQFVVFASLILSAIPTLIVFILAQRVIMRGIIIPVEK
jgi:ABC-type glycerol-3-phosphate transport system permease component